MRFSLQDVKKQVRRRGGELFVGLQFLRADEYRTEIERLIAYYEELLGQPKRQFFLDEARACVGDYRLADCLTATLSAWYTWRQCAWSEVLERMENGEQARSALSDAGITSPVSLRLALFDYVNAQHRGFLVGAMRDQALREVATPYRLALPDLEYLLKLDSDDEALLTRVTPRLPTAQEVILLYNQWVFEAALSNASQVYFVIDCAAFQRGQPEAGLGAVIKRLCFLARKLGVYYDFAYEDPSTSIEEKGTSQSNVSPLLLRLTLYGPQEMTGLPQQYGQRLAQMCRLLLGYGLRSKVGDGKRRGKTLLPGSVLEAEATIHFSQRSYRFEMDSALLALLGGQSTGTAGQKSPRPEEASTIFDSSIEQAFAEAFGALERGQGVDGWHLEREPEPLLLARSIFIPDFALSRPGRRIYMEILGFWTPMYRERKIQKLRQLKSRDDLVLAIPQEARDAFASINAEFPIVWYASQLSVTEILHVLRSRYDDFGERLALIDVAAIREQVRRQGLITEQASYGMLQCYRRSELVRAAERVVGEDIAFAVGIGLYQLDWMEHLRRSFVEWMADTRPLALAEVLREVRERWPVLAGCEDATLEALLGLWPEIRVRRGSIFEAVVEYLIATDDREEDAVEVETVVEGIGQTSAKKRQTRVKERRVVQKQQPGDEMAQGDLWT